MGLIDKSVLIAELNKRINEYNTPIDRLGSNNIRLHECKDLLSFLDTLEVKEVDLAKEYDNNFSNDPVYSNLVNRNAGIGIAKYFYELGLKQKGE